VLQCIQRLVYVDLAVDMIVVPACTSVVPRIIVAPCRAPEC
jgi:hypothetical protein